MPTADSRRSCLVSYSGGKFSKEMPASEAEKMARRFIRAGDKTAHVILNIT